MCQVPAEQRPPSHNLPGPDFIYPGLLPRLLLPLLGPAMAAWQGRKATCSVRFKIKRCDLENPRA